MSQQGTPPPADDGEQQFPIASFPTVFADGVLSLSRGPGVVKFYLFRTDPHFKGIGTVHIAPFAQVIMPTRSFVATAAFFESQVKVMIEKGEITSAMVSEFRQLYPSTADPKNVV